MLYGCLTWSLSAVHLAKLPQAHHRLLLRCIPSKSKRRDSYYVLSYADALAKIGGESVETTERKRRTLFAGFVACMDNERLPKQVTFGGVEEGNGKLGGQDPDWIRRFENRLGLLKLPTEAKHSTMAAKNRGKWFRRDEEAAEKYVKRWFVTDMETVTKPRALQLRYNLRLR